MSDLPRLCVFGDSHYACVRQAEARGLVDVRGVELEYWGNVGGRFRYLEFRDGAIHPPDAAVASRFARFNAKGRTFLPAAEFDALLVMGARVYVWRVFFRVFQMLCDGPFASEGLQRRVLADGIRGYQGYRLAAGLASTRTARVVLAPVAYYTASPAHVAAITPRMAELIDERLPWFWEAMTAAAAEDGIQLIRQPDETVVEGMFTDPAYAVEDHVAKSDYEHHNARYGALILARALDIARGLRRPEAAVTMPARMEAGC